jgi:phytoene desaturase
MIASGEWRGAAADVSERRDPLHDSYDVVVVGAGLGGLSVSAALAKLGKSVLVVEQHHTPGGYAHVFERNGYRFDPAIHYTAQGNPGELLDVLLNLLGVRDEVNLITSELEYGVRLPGLTVKNPVGIEAFIEENARQFPHEADGIRGFFQLCVDATRESQQAAQRLSLQELDKAVSQLPLLFRYRMATVSEVIDEFVTDPQAKALCGAIWPYMGPPPSKAAFMVYAGLLYAALETGPIYCEGSFQNLANAFATALQKHGGELVLQTRVERIPVEDGRVTGVVLDSGQEIRATTVVSNADAIQTFEGMIGAEHLPKQLQRQLQRMTLSDSAFVVFAATTIDVTELGLPHEMLIYKHWDHEQTYADVLAGKPGGLWITFPTTFDPSLAPAGEHLVILSSLARYDIGIPWSEARAAFTESMLAEIEEVLPGFAKQTTFVESATPEAFERYTLNRRGAIYGWAATPNQSTGKRLKQRTLIDGLYLSGHWTEPGAGSFRAIFSGVTAATQIAGLAGLDDFGKAMAGLPTSA